MKAAIIKALVLGLAISFVHGQSGFNLTGNADLSKLSMQSNQGTTSILNQRYALSCNRSFTPYISADAGLHFSYQDEDLNHAHIFQSDLQPRGQLAWNSPWFSLGGNGSRLISESDRPEADLYRDNASVSFRTKPEKWPRLSFVFDLDRMYTPKDLQARDTYVENLLGGLSWQYRTLNLSANANGQQTENPNASTIERRFSQNFRWDDNENFFDRKLRVRMDYSLNHQSQEFEKPDFVPVLEWVPLQKTYFAVDHSPEFSELDSVNGLLDGNKITSVSPEILLSQTHTDGNIALDFGNQKEIGAVFLYANKKPLIPGIWTVYTSKAQFLGSGMQWDPLLNGVDVRFDEAYMRFEISFPNTKSQFLKVVFKGTTDTASISITELEAFKRDEGSGSPKQHASTQSLSLNTTYLICEGYDLSMDMGFQNEPFSSSEVKKKMTFISLYPATSGICPC